MPLRDLGRRLRRRISRPRGYEPAAYWEERAAELVDIYDHPESWAERGWMRGDAEEAVVPALLGEAGVHTVLVPGAGSGRQYAYLAEAGFEARGFDISPSLAKVCRARFPGIPTHVGSVVDADLHEEAADAVISSAVLQHVPPAEIARATAALQTLARRLIVVRELTLLDATSTYQFAHDYAALFAGWTELYRETTDERPLVRVELIAWRR